MEHNDCLNGTQRHRDKHERPLCVLVSLCSVKNLSLYYVLVSLYSVKVFLCINNFVS